MPKMPPRKTFIEEGCNQGRRDSYFKPIYPFSVRLQFNEGDSNERAASLRLKISESGKKGEKK